MGAVLRRYKTKVTCANKLTVSSRIRFFPDFKLGPGLGASEMFKAHDFRVNPISLIPSQFGVIVILTPNTLFICGLFSTAVSSSDYGIK
jgi:hypothetical protein